MISDTSVDTALAIRKLEAAPFSGTSAQPFDHGALRQRIL